MNMVLCLIKIIIPTFQVEYRQIRSTHPRIKYLHPSELAKNWKQYVAADFIVTYSSLGMILN